MGAPHEPLYIDLMYTLLTTIPQLLTEVIMEINYDRCNVSQRIKTEIIRAQGEQFWNELTQGIEIPTDDMEENHCSACMKTFMDQFERMLPAEDIRGILVNVRHDLQRDDFDWAVKMFNEIGNLDQFALALQRVGVGEIEDCYSRGERYYGMPLTPEVMDVVHGMENIFYGRRHGDVILAQAIPANIDATLHAADDQQRRYALCHCQFARKSILRDGEQVSPLLCSCSLGHTMMLWEIVLDRKLEGEVVESALNGDPRCLFRIKLPDDVLERWT